MTSEPGIEPGTNREMVIRIASAAVLVPVVLAATAHSLWSFMILLLGAAFILAWEWATLVRGTNRFGEPTFLVHLVAILTAIVCWGAGLSWAAIGALVLGGLGAVLMTPMPKRLMASLGVFYIGVPCLSLMWLRSDPQYGFYAVLFVFLVVWSVDSGALVFGRVIGGPRLSPKISPNKTWAGAVGGLLAGAIAGLAFAQLFGGTDTIVLAVVALGLGAATLLGDLLESGIKRYFGVKDISGMIPGHGGLLDRVDGLLFAACVAALVSYAHGFSAPVWEGAGASLLYWSGFG